jgi:tol-pal system protein YbgF
MNRLLSVSGLVVVAFAAGCASTPPEDDPVQQKLNDLDQRTVRIERVMSNNSLLDMAQRVDALQAQIRTLQGRVEELQNSNEALRKQQRDLYADLDKRIAQLGAAGAAAGVGAAGPPVPSSYPSGEQGAYSQALDTLKAGRYADAITNLKQFLSTYPRSNLADNAEYWLGEAYYVQRDFPSAATAFRAVGEQWPSSRKAPDALLKVGYCQVELKHYGEARATLKDVMQRFPDSDAAKLAGERLRTLPPSGGGASDSDTH